MQMIAAGTQIPALDVTSADGSAVSLRASGRTARVTVTVHAGCDECAQYVRALEAERDGILEWDGRVIVVAAGDGAVDAEHFHSASADPALLVDAGLPVPGVLIADQWGELFEVCDAGAAHDFIAPAEVVAWLRYLAIVCPECQGEAL